MKQNAQRMYNRALFYLQRFSATEKHLATVLKQQLDRKKRKGEEITAEAYTWIAPTVAKCVALGLVNDRNFAESRLLSLRRQGRSTSYIKQHLQLKGVPKEIIQEYMGEQNPDDEMEAALRHIERRRLGRDLSPEGQQKDLAKLARAGFSFDVAKTALKGQNRDS